MNLAIFFIVSVKFWAVWSQDNNTDIAKRKQLLVEDILFHVATNKSSGFETKGAEVICLRGNMCIAISSKFFKMQDISFVSWDSLKLSEPCRNAVVSSDRVGDARTLCTTEGFMTCGTEMDINDTHVIFRNTLRTREIEDVNYPNVVIGPYRNHVIPWDCTYPLNYLVSLSSASLESHFHYLPVTSQIRQITVDLGDSGMGYGMFHVGMFLYSNAEYVTALALLPNFNMEDRIYVGITLLDGPMETVIDVKRCWGTPTMSRDDDITFDLIENYCPTQDFVKLHDTGSVMPHFYWSSDVFRFRNHTSVYLHCEVQICFYQFQLCYKNYACSSFPQRKKRSSAASDDDKVLTVGPLTVTDEVPLVEKRTGSTSNNTVPDNRNDIVWSIVFGGIIMTSSITLCVIGYFVYRKIWRRQNCE